MTFNKGQNGVIQRLAKVGQIVLMRNPLAPPSQWELGRITACYPSDNGLIRVVTIKINRSEYKRPVVKVCFLPVAINTEESEIPSRRAKVPFNVTNV